MNPRTNNNKTMAMIGKFSTSKSLYLTWNKLSNTDLTELAKNLNKTKIQKVDLSFAQFGNQENLGEFIRQTKKVEEIRFVL